MVFFFATKAAFKSVDIGTAIFKNAPVQFSTRALKRLEEKGVIFARLKDVEGVESYSAVYKGEILVPNGSSKDLRKSLDSAWNKTDDLVEELDAILLAQNADDYKELLKNWDNVSGRGRRLGQRISKSDLNKIKTFLGKMNVGFDLHPEKRA